MNIWGFLLIILGIVVAIGIFQQGGWEGFSKDPLQSTWQSSKTIAEVSKDAFDKGKEFVAKNSDTLKNLGLPLCQEDSDCNTLNECNNENANCTCDIPSGNCFLKN